MRAEFSLIASMVASGSKVLDVGCGDGSLLDYLRQHCAVDGRGIELDQMNVQHCLERGLAVVQGNADFDLYHYPDQSFDVVISVQMIQATQHPKQVLQELKRIGKKVIVMIPNFGYWRNRWYFMLHGAMPVTKTLPYQWYDTPNIHFCTIKDFNHLCRSLALNVTILGCLKRERIISTPLSMKLMANFLAEYALFYIQ
jgi:methionine biosynthesis protein MetW